MQAADLAAAEASLVELEAVKERDRTEEQVAELEALPARVEELIAAKKPIIGHNMIYDIIYLYNQFIDDLPQTYPEFI
jgi:hypothetical protein